MAHTRSGTLKANLSGGTSYESFVPAPLPPNPPIKFDEELSMALVKASGQLSIMNSFTQQESVKMFIPMLARREALASCEMEGFQATIEDILDPYWDYKYNNGSVCSVVELFVETMEFTCGKLSRHPISNDLLKNAHALLTGGTRGQNPGVFRMSQNWIGDPGCGLENARYIPPNPEDMQTAIKELETYINEPDSATMHPLIKAALVHYQFEAIQPFLEENDRIGRLLIIWLLILKSRLPSAPALGMSCYFKKHQEEYYERLEDVRKRGAFEEWAKFFLKAVVKSSQDSCIRLLKLSLLHTKNYALLNKMPNPAAAKIVFSYIEKHPIAEAQMVAEDLRKDERSVLPILHGFLDNGILGFKGDFNDIRFIYNAFLDILREEP
ncbi:MAG: Fic family protein [Clostridiales bacterium]|jgi:Fic family protein|nr:Fic family protein [Clostridiales bacterium]